MGMYKGSSVWSFLWLGHGAREGASVCGAPCMHGGEGVGGGVLVIFCAAPGRACSRSRVSISGSNRTYVRALGQRAYARRQAFDLFSPPKFCFTPEPVCLDTERRRPPSVPFSGHSSHAI